MIKPNDNLWHENFNVYKDYVDTFHKLPTAIQKHKDVSIGNWLHHQRTLIKKGKLADDKIDILSDHCPFWNGSKEEVIEGNINLLITSDWRKNIEEDKFPIDKFLENLKIYNETENGDFFKKMDLAYLLEKKIYDLETFITINKPGLNKNLKSKLYEFDLFGCYEILFDFVDKNYGHLLCDIYGIDYRSMPCEEMETFWKSFGFKTKEDLINYIECLFDSLFENEVQIIKSRYYLGEDVAVSNKRVFVEVGEINNITKQRVQQIEKRAFEKLRNMLNVLEIS